MRQSMSTVAVRKRRRNGTWGSQGRVLVFFFCACAYMRWCVHAYLLPNVIYAHQPSFSYPFSHSSLSSSIINIPGESPLRRDFLRLQLANKERSEALRRQQLEQQQNEEHKRLLLAERQKRIEEQKEQRRRLEEVDCMLFTPSCPPEHNFSASDGFCSHCIFQLGSMTYLVTAMTLSLPHTLCLTATA